MRVEFFHVLQICLGRVQTATVEEAEVPLLERQERSHRITAQD